MLNYKEIDKLFGTPLNHIPKPHIPYQFKMRHLVGAAIGFYIICKGLSKIYDDVFNVNGKKGLISPIALKNTNKEK
jgi:hypothetical protein